MVTQQTKSTGYNKQGNISSWLTRLCNTCQAKEMDILVYFRLYSNWSSFSSQSRIKFDSPGLTLLWWLDIMSYLIPFLSIIGQFRHSIKFMMLAQNYLLKVPPKRKKEKRVEGKEWIKINTKRSTVFSSQKDLDWQYSCIKTWAKTRNFRYACFA